MGIDLTLNFCLSSLDRGADMSTRLMWEGALKCLFLFFLLEDVTSLLYFILTLFTENPKYHVLLHSYKCLGYCFLHAKRQVAAAIISMNNINETQNIHSLGWEIYYKFNK